MQLELTLGYPKQKARVQNPRSKSRPSASDSRKIISNDQDPSVAVDIVKNKKIRKKSLRSQVVYSGSTTPVKVSRQGLFLAPPFLGHFQPSKGQTCPLGSYRYPVLALSFSAS